VVGEENIQRSEEEKREEEMWWRLVDPETLMTLKIRLRRISLHVLMGFGALNK
jgi:hypothetical protein